MGQEIGEFAKEYPQKNYCGYFLVDNNDIR